MDNLVDPELLTEIRKYGRFDVNACMNCGSCTLSCDLSADHAAFPRKTMQRALFGLRGSLDRSLEPWLCHDCGECSEVCPRHAEPRESMATLRRYLAGRYDFSGLSSRMLRSKCWAILSLTAAALIFLALFACYHLVYAELTVDDMLSMPLGLEHMFGMIVDFTLVVVAIPLVVMAVNALRMYRYTMGKPSGERIPARHYFAEFKTMLSHAVSHENIRKCMAGAGVKRWKKHWLLGLAYSMKIVIIVFFLGWFQTDTLYPVYHPQRWIGYFIAAVLIAFPVDILVGRMRKKEEIHRFTQASDLTFPVTMLLTAVSGLAVHVFRYADMPMACLYSYALHLAFAVSLLVIEMPFGKFSHVLYRPMALYFQSVRVLAAEASKPRPEATAPAGVVPEGVTSA